MSKKIKWKGKKKGGDHSTIIDSAQPLIKKLMRSEIITKISPGFISPGKARISTGTVKISLQKGSILLGVRSTSFHQEFRVFATDYEKAVELIQNESAKKKFNIIIQRLI